LKDFLAKCKKFEVKTGKCVFSVLVEGDFSRKLCRKGDVYDCVICIRKNVDYVQKKKEM